MSTDVDNSTCPACGSPQLEGGFVEIQGMEAVQAVSCTECEAAWKEVYSFSRRDNINEGTPKT